jgi:hypothetical protein
MIMESKCLASKGKLSYPGVGSIDRFGSKIANIMAEKAMTTNWGNTTATFTTPWVVKVLSSHDNLQVQTYQDNSRIVSDSIRVFHSIVRARMKSRERIP